MKKFIFLPWLVFLIMLTSFAFCQSRQISGKVTDETGKPVPLATVQQKGTKNAASANENGDFIITVSGKNPTLLISSVNYEPMELSIGSESSYTVVLQNGGKLSEVVVTALGIQREKKSLGYSAQTVSAKELTESHQSNLLNALQGKVAGVTITSAGGC